MGQGKAGARGTYLETHFNLLSQSPFREYGLDLRDHGGAQHSSASPDGVGLLPNAGDDCKVLWEVIGDDATQTSVRVQIVVIC